MRKEYGLSMLGLMIIWYVAAIVIANDIILPNPIDVFFTCFSLLWTPSFYQTIMTSIIRVFIGYVISFIVAFICAMTAEECKLFKRLMAPIEHFLKSIPNISYIILSLIWVGQEKGVILVIFFVSFPLLYTQMVDGLMIDDEDLKDVSCLFGKSRFDNLLCLKLPMAIPSILVAISTTLGLSFKVGITAEILNQTKGGIGYQLYLAKANLEMVDLFAWTLWMVVLSYLIYQMIISIIKLFTKKWTY